MELSEGVETTEAIVRALAPVGSGPTMAAGFFFNKFHFMLDGYANRNPDGERESQDEMSVMRGF